MGLRTDDPEIEPSPPRDCAQEHRAVGWQLSDEREPDQLLVGVDGQRGEFSRTADEMVRLAGFGEQPLDDVALDGRLS